MTIAILALKKGFVIPKMKRWLMKRQAGCPKKS